MERVFAAKDPSTARRACFIGAAGTLIIGIPFSFVALSGTHVLEMASVALVEGQPILYTMLGSVFPVFLAAIVLAGIVAASMSTGDGAILGTSAVIARNIFGISSGETRRGGDQLLRWTRIFAIPISICGQRCRTHQASCLWETRSGKRVQKQTDGVIPVGPLTEIVPSPVGRIVFVQNDSILLEHLTQLFDTCDGSRKVGTHVSRKSADDDPLRLHALPTENNALPIVCHSGA